MLRFFYIFGLVFSIFIAEFSFAQSPTTPATKLAFTNVYCQQLRVSWTNGNGSNRIVVARQGSNINQYPADNAIYNASDTFGRGEQIGSLNYVVYRGTGSSTTVIGLTKNTTYYFAVFEYNTVGGFYYLTSSYAEESITTEDISADFDIDLDYQCINGNSFKFTNKAASSLSLSMTYRWDFGDLATSNNKDVTHSYTKGNVYSVKLTTFATGCTTSITKQDTVVTPAYAFFGLDPSLGNDSIQCFNTNLFKFKNRAVVDPIAGTIVDETNYTWHYGDGQKNQGYDAQHKYTTPGVYDIKFVTQRRITHNGLRPYCYDSITLKYRVLPPPLTTGSLKMSDAALCLNGNVFTFSHTSPDIVTTKWTFGDGNTAFGNPKSHSYTNSGLYYIRLDVSDIQGCKDSMIDSVRVYDQPNNNITGLKTEYCVGDPKVTLHPLPQYSGGKFFGPNVNPSDSTFDPNIVGTFIIGYEFVLGGCKDSVIYTVVVHDLPRFNLGNDTLICEGDVITLTVPLANMISYTWNGGTNTQSNAISTGGNKSVEVFDGKCKFKDDLNIKQIKAPLFELGKDTQLCGGNQWKLDVSSDLATYDWSDGFTGPVNIVSTSGNYKVTVTNICGSYTDSLKIHIEEFACTIFIPNAISPNLDGQNEFFIPIGNYKLKNIKIYNIWGEELYNSPSTKGWDGTYAGEIVPIGVYFFIVDFLIVEGPSYVLKSSSGPLHVVY